MNLPLCLHSTLGGFLGLFLAWSHSLNDVWTTFLATPPGASAPDFLQGITPKVELTEFGVCKYSTHRPLMWWLLTHLSSRSVVWLYATPWTVAYQAPPFLRFPRQDFWSRLPFPSPGDLPDPGIEPRSPSLQAEALPSEPPGKPPSVMVRAFNLGLLERNRRYQEFHSPSYLNLFIKVHYKEKKKKKEKEDF